MRKDRILERDHKDYVRAERDVLTAVVHPYIVTLRYSFQVRAQTRPQHSLARQQCPFGRHDGSRVVGGDVLTLH